MDRLGADDRPQEDRDHVPGPHVRLLPAGRRRGAADALAAGGAEQHADQRRALQRAAHAPWHDDDLPVRRPGDGRLRQLLRAADDRRPGHGLPAPQRALVLAAAAGRHRLLRLALLAPAGSRLVELPAALQHSVLAERWSGRLDLPDPPHRHIVAGRRHQLLRDDRQHAGTGHDLGPDAAVHLVDPDLRRAADHRPAGHRGRRHDAAHRPALRHPLVRSDQPRLAGPLGEPLLVLRASRGLHHDPPGIRHHLRGTFRSSRASRSSDTRRSRRPRS